MTAVVVAMLLALLLSLAVVAVVAVPARREGREVLTPQGEQLVQAARERTGEVASAARARTGEAASAARARTSSRPSSTAPSDAAHAEQHREDLSA